MLNLIDEFTHECLAIRVDRKLKSVDGSTYCPISSFLRGVPEHTLCEAYALGKRNEGAPGSDG